MKNYSLFFLLLIGLLIANCKQDNNTTSLLINTAGTGSAKWEVFNIPTEIHHKITNKKDSLKIEIEEEIILDLLQGRTHHYVHVKPGDKLLIDTLPAAEILLGVSKFPSKENDYLVEFAQINEVQSKTFHFPDMTKKEVDSFLLLVNQKYEPLEKLVSNINQDKDISEPFKAALKLRLLANKGNDLLGYKSMYNYWNKNFPELPEGFYNELEAIDFSKPTLLLFEEGRRLGDSWSTKDISFSDYPSAPAYFTACLENVNKKYPASLLRDYCFYNTAANNINFGGGIDDSETIIANFKSTVTNKYLNNKLDETIAPWLTLKSGLEAPDFIAKKRDDVEVPLSALKGKKVYIDVWATWCGPCIKEIPALKELEAELHEENIEFVSVSIDKEKDKEKWLNFIEEKQLTGLQLMANGDWKSDIASAYNIKGIPRFLLIDEAGKIISANAPRPSAPNIKEVLLN